MAEKTVDIGVQSQAGITGLWVLSVATIAVSIACYAAYNHLGFRKGSAESTSEELDELLLQEDDSKLAALKFSRERSSTLLYRYMMVAIVSLVVLGLCVVSSYSAFLKQDQDSRQATETQREEAFCKMYDLSHNLEHQLKVSDAEKRKKSLQHEADKDSLQRRHEQNLSTTVEQYQQKMANQKKKHDKEIAYLNSRIDEVQRGANNLQQECVVLKERLQCERREREKLTDEMNKQANDQGEKTEEYAREKQEWEREKL